MKKLMWYIIVVMMFAGPVFGIDTVCVNTEAEATAEATAEANNNVVVKANNDGRLIMGNQPALNFIVQIPDSDKAFLANKSMPYTVRLWEGRVWTDGEISFALKTGGKTGLKKQKCMFGKYPKEKDVYIDKLQNFSKFIEEKVQGDNPTFKWTGANSVEATGTGKLDLIALFNAIDEAKKLGAQHCFVIEGMGIVNRAMTSQLGLSQFLSSLGGTAVVGGSAGKATGEPRGKPGMIVVHFRSVEVPARNQETQEETQRISGAIIEVPVKNSNGSISIVEIKKIPYGYTGPRGEFYDKKPEAKQLAIYAF